jgi:hypothetical protein
MKKEETAHFNFKAILITQFSGKEDMMMVEKKEKSLNFMRVSWDFLLLFLTVKCSIFLDVDNENDENNVKNDEKKKKLKK